MSIEEFLTNDEYLGNYTNHGKDIYATWLEELKYVHNPLTFCDQWAITGSTGTGKAQPLTSRILTPNGYVLMKNIQIGDTIIDGDGDLTKVTHIYPQGKLSVYRITLTDNTEVLSADNHLWVLRDLNSFSKKLKVMELSEILNTDMKSGNTYRYELPNTKINCFNKTIEFNPYVLAYLFNNYKLHKNSQELEILKVNQESIPKLRQLLTEQGYALRRRETKFYIKSINKSNTTLLDALKEIETKSELTYTKEIRLQMLEGFIDRLSTKKGTLDIKDLKTSNYLSFLVRTLGGIDKTYIKPKEVRRKDLPTKAAYYYYEHKIRLPKELNLGYTITSKLSRRIKKIEYIGKTECQCIVVDSPNHCYITDTEVVTHNSTVATYSMCYELYKLLCLKNPNRYYLGAQETIWILFFNLSLGLAEKTMFGKFQKAIQSSPWFMKNGTVTGRTNLVYQPHKDVKIGLGSTEEHALSIAVMFCLSGKTEIYTENGFIPIEQLKDKEIKVYTLNKDGTTQLTDEPVVVKQTGITNELYEITLENGHKFRCTPDHKMLLSDGTYKEAKDLSLTDDLVEVNTNCGIYKLTNKLNGKSYIGQSKQLTNRKYQHLNTNKNHLILKDTQGIDFKNHIMWEVLEYCPQEMLNQREQYYINKYNTLYPNGYNQQSGGLNNFFTCETYRQKMKTIGKQIFKENKNKILKNVRQNLLNRHWVNNGVQNKYIYNEQLEYYKNQGYKPGRILSNATKIDKIFICNLLTLETKQIDVQDLSKYETLGFTKGILRENNYIWSFDNLRFIGGIQLLDWLRNHNYPDISYTTISKLSNGKSPKGYEDLSGRITKQQLSILKKEDIDED